MVEISFAVSIRPAVVKVGRYAAARIMKRKHRASIVVLVGIAAREISRGIHAAAQAVHTRMVIFAAAAIVVVAILTPGIVIWAARRIGQRSEIVIERMV